MRRVRRVRGWEREELTCTIGPAMRSRNSLVKSAVSLPQVSNTTRSEHCRYSWKELQQEEEEELHYRRREGGREWGRGRSDTEERGKRRVKEEGRKERSDEEEEEREKKGG